jgi:choline dehydrogenase
MPPAVGRLAPATIQWLSEFRVRGVQSFRVVDASAFPKIPGIFILAPIFIMSEKAADVMLNDNQLG